jgi:hypothetical protein
MRRTDLQINEKYNYLTIIAFEKIEQKNNRKAGKTYTTICKCMCDCGKIHFVMPSKLKNNKVKSCGCFNSEKLRNRNLKHGKTRSKIYTAWVNMRNRCEDKKNKSYANYGGRGISYDLAWKNFMNFYNDMIADYKQNYTLERIDVNANYSKLNCTWIPQKDQKKNQRNSVEYFYIDKWMRSWEIMNVLQITKNQFKKMKLPKRKLYEDG